MKERLKTEMKEAMKAKDAVKLSTIRGVLSEIQYDEMQKGISDASITDVMAILQRELKKRKEEIEFAEKGNRPELLEKLLIEISVLESFLPKQMTKEELSSFFASLKANDATINQGGAMKSLKDSHNGQYDGKLAATVAKEVFG
jgi:uncharacterized protein YqeY